MLKNKKANIGFRFFGFIFAVTIVSAIMTFFLLALPLILHDYALQQGVSVNQDLVNLGVSSAASQTAIENLTDNFLSFLDYVDYFFIFFIVSLFIESLFAASQAKRLGIYTFFGFLTIGNLLLIFALTFAVEISNWFINNITNNIILIAIETPFMDWFFNYNIYIGTIWFGLILLVNIFDIKSIASRFKFTSSGDEDIIFEE